MKSVFKKRKEPKPGVSPSPRKGSLDDVVGARTPNSAGGGAGSVAPGMGGGESVIDGKAARGNDGASGKQKASGAGGASDREKEKDKKKKDKKNKDKDKKDKEDKKEKVSDDASAAGDGKARPSYRLDKEGGAVNKDKDGSMRAGSSHIRDGSSAPMMDSSEPAEKIPGGSVSSGTSGIVTRASSTGAGGKDSHAANSASAQKASHILSSAGTHRLNRILRNTNVNAELATTGRGFAAGLSAIDDKNAGPIKMERVSNPTKIPVVADFASKVVIPPLKVDPRSIGGSLGIYPASMQQETLLCFKCRNFESTGTEAVALSGLEYPADYAKHKRSLGLLTGLGTAKGRNKLKYVIIARSTNQPLIAQKKKQTTPGTKESGTGGTDGQDGKESNKNNFGYDTMFSDKGGPGVADADAYDELADDSTREGEDASVTHDDDNSQNPTDNNNKNNMNNLINEPNVQVADDDDEEEISSFPVLCCMTFHNDGTSPDIRKLIQLDKLTTVQDLQGNLVQLVFSNGDTVRLDFADLDKGRHMHNRADQTNDELTEVKGGGSSNLNKERFIWCLLQIHAMLCVSVVERTSLGTNQSENGSSATMKDGGLLPPLNVRNIDRAELQYLATVNRFVLQYDTLRILLNRQKQLADTTLRNAAPGLGEALEAKEKDPAKDPNKNDAKTTALEEMDEMAYDLMMGNFATRVAIFQNDAEKKDAEEILNSTEWTVSLKLGKGRGPNFAGEQDTAAATAAERLSNILQKRMRDLEAETCRRLIAWEDEKHYSKRGQKSPSHATVNDSVDALSLASLFTTLDSLDKELLKMESWLQERAAAIKPMTDDCQDIEEENRQLEQQWKSYDMLGAEMRKLLHGLEVGEKVERILNNPASALVYKSDGSIDVDESEQGVDEIHSAGKALQDATQHVYKCGGLQLKAVRERADALEQTANIFCTALAQIIVTVMEQFKTEVVAGSDYGKVSKSDTHSMIAKKIRDTQRKFQSSLLGYIKLIEILAELSPELLPAVRDAYSEMVAEGIMMKKRMKGYFQALPGKNASYLKNVSKDLRDYVPFEMVKEDTVHAEDIRYALSELLPVIAREAYFTAALFGLSSKAQDGREKKRNFEAAKKSADHSSQYFNYYIQRTCGIIQDFEPPDPHNNHNHGNSHQNQNMGDPMLCLIASIHLNEAMASYIDREKKGGDHSLSLAYVRATILELRKKVDKQWVAWVDRQIEWIRTHHGVPANGKRAGIIPSFARFPCYLDHILLCCREGRKETYTPDFANIKVVSYYLQKMATALLESLRECCERDTTDQQYAANVMSMENTYFFTQRIKERGNHISNLFKKQIIKANTTCKQSTDSYLGWMIKREFTSLHELFSKISKARREVGDKQVISHIPKSTFVRTLAKESSRDVLKEKIATLHARMGKHLSEQGGLLPVAWKALVKVLYEWFGRWEKLAQQCYNHKLDPSAVDVVRIAKAAGSTTTRKTDADNKPDANASNNPSNSAVIKPGGSAPIKPGNFSQFQQQGQPFGIPSVERNPHSYKDYTPSFGTPGGPGGFMGSANR